MTKKGRNEKKKEESRKPESRLKLVQLCDHTAAACQRRQLFDKYGFWLVSDSLAPPPPNSSHLGLRLFGPSSFRLHPLPGLRVFRPPPTLAPPLIQIGAAANQCPPDGNCNSGNEAKITLLATRGQQCHKRIAYKVIVIHKENL